MNRAKTSAPLEAANRLRVWLCASEPSHTPKADDPWTKKFDAAPGNLKKSGALETAIDLINAWMGALCLFADPAKLCR